MRKIKVKEGSSRYRLSGDDGVFIGDLIITYSPNDSACSLDIAKKGSSLDRLSIEAKRGVN